MARGLAVAGGARPALAPPPAPPLALQRRRQLSWPGPAYGGTLPGAAVARRPRARFSPDVGQPACPVRAAPRAPEKAHAISASTASPILVRTSRHGPHASTRRPAGSIAGRGRGGRPLRAREGSPLSPVVTGLQGPRGIPRLAERRDPPMEYGRIQFHDAGMQDGRQPPGRRNAVIELSSQSRSKRPCPGFRREARSPGPLRQPGGYCYRAWPGYRLVVCVTISASACRAGRTRGGSGR